MPLDPVALDDPHVPAHNEERDAINTLQTQMSGKITLPAGAATGDLLRFDGEQWVTTDTRYFEGEGNPNGVLAAPVGSRYIDKVATFGAVEWVKSTGGDSNQGWFTLSGDSGWYEVGASGSVGFAAGWANYNQGWTTVAYRKINGIVYLKGMAYRASGPRASVIFTLPVGLRPSGNTHLPAFAGSLDDMFSAVNVFKNGEVRGRGPTPGYLSLDGLSFPADF